MFYIKQFVTKNLTPIIFGEVGFQTLTRPIAFGGRYLPTHQGLTSDYNSITTFKKW